MQITSIQNVIRNNFQYKNNPIKFNPINFKGQDTFERSIADNVIVTKKYYRGENEIDPSLLMQQGQTLFIKSKDSYIPYNASLKEYNAKGEIVRHSFYGNGFKNIVNTYKNGKIVQRDEYKDIFSSVKNTAKRTAVVKFNYSEENKPAQTFGISRNYGSSWKNHPEIAIRKNGKNDSLFVCFTTSSDDKNGEIKIFYTNKNKTTHYTSPIYNYDELGLTVLEHPIESTNETAYLALLELKETLESKEFKADFGNNDKLNSELNKTIEFLGSILNAG